MAKEPKEVKISEISVLHLDAGHDRNGNAQRVFVLYHPVHGTMATVDEGAAGRGALKLCLGGLTHKQLDVLDGAISGKIPTSKSFYRECLRFESKMRDFVIVS